MNNPYMGPVPPVECDGGPYCRAPRHVEGCFATTQRESDLLTENRRLREALERIRELGSVRGSFWKIANGALESGDE